MALLLLGPAPVALAQAPTPADSLRVHQLLTHAKQVGSDTLRHRQLLQQALRLSQAVYYWKEGLQLRRQVPGQGVLVLLAASLASYYNDNEELPAARKYLELCQELSSAEAGRQYRFQYL
jgi:hypothetical protein